MKYTSLLAAIAAIATTAAIPTAQADVIAPDLVTSEAVFWFDASTLYSSVKGAGGLVWRDNNVLAFADADKKGLNDKLKPGSKSDGKAQKLAD